MDPIIPPSHQIEYKQEQKQYAKPSYEALELKVAQLTKKNKNRKYALESLGKSHCEKKRLLAMAQDEANFWEGEYQRLYTSLQNEYRPQETRIHNANKKSWWQFWK